MSSARIRRVPAELSAPVEDYLKAIYELERSGEPAETNAISVSGYLPLSARC